MTFLTISWYSYDPNYEGSAYKLVYNFKSPYSDENINYLAKPQLNRKKGQIYLAEVLIIRTKELIH